MSRLMGPVLSFRGYDLAAQQWNLTALVVADAAPGDLSAGGQAVSPDALWKVGSRTAYRYTFSFPVKAKPSTASYKVLGKAYEVALPAADKAPTMAYASCNGFSSLKLRNNYENKEPNAVWTIMAKQHGKTPYHLLLLGGDQVYADEMFETEGPMKPWINMNWDDANKAPVPAQMQGWLDIFYFNLYTDRWAQPEVAEMLATVPSIMMWDDHDLMDGWGSYPVERQTCAVFGAIWKSASKAYAVFQQHLKDGELHPKAIGNARPGSQNPVKKGAFSFGHIVGPIAILAVDMRSQRTAQTQVVGKEHWEEIYDWVDSNDLKDVSHLLVMSSIPVVYPDFKTVESLLGIFPGHQDLEDDLRDHWNSPPHKGERTRMVHRLFEITDKGDKHIRATLVSGDVHVGALGVIQNTREKATGRETVMNQLISSGIVHPNPGGIVLFALQHLFGAEDPIDEGICARMMEIPGTKSKFLGTRNYLSLEPDEKDQIYCKWYAENEQFPFTKVIHALSPGGDSPER